jgi:hypothetical protein
VQVVVLLLMGRRIIQQALHHGLLALPVLSHRRPELGGSDVEHLHGHVVYGPLVDGGHILCVVRHALIDLHGRRPPHPLRDLT